MPNPTHTMRVGIIGAGAMGRNHARIYAELADLQGVCDTDPQVGKEVAERFGTPHYASHDALLREDLDAVSIATPTRLHFEVARDAIKQGVHVLLEKPFCANVEEARRLSQIAQKEGVVLAAGMVERHNPAVEYARNALRDGQYGKVIAVTARRVSSFPSRIRDVGVMMDLGIHDVDVMRYLVGARVVQVYGMAGQERHGTFEDHATAALTFENGVHGIVEVNWLTPMKVRKLALTCLENYVELDYINQTLEVSSSTLTEYDPSNLYQPSFEYDVRQVAMQQEEPLRREIEDFLHAIEDERPPLVDGPDATETLRVMEAVVASHRKGEPVRLT